MNEVQGWALTAEQVCTWHAENWDGDPEWAKRFLDGLEKRGEITPEEAAGIRELVGWKVQKGMVFDE